MIDADTTALLTQFGTAGLIGWLWLSERRASGERERQLASLHERLMQERRGLEVAVEALRDNTRVLSGVEAGQRALLTALETIARQTRPSTEVRPRT
ncbi:MAG: hypothetical protein HBSAPP03_04930 [Phycisphaerae bacterium]|nr:MAG: hypothetical protein HBSAPP03_04930 [Phycisphaerae bacterium]